MNQVTCRSPHALDTAAHCTASLERALQASPRILISSAASVASLLAVQHQDRESLAASHEVAQSEAHNWTLRRGAQSHLQLCADHNAADGNRGAATQRRHCTRQICARHPQASPAQGCCWQTRMQRQSWTMRSTLTTSCRLWRASQRCAAPPAQARTAVKCISLHVGTPHVGHDGALHEAM